MTHQGRNVSFVEAERGRPMKLSIRSATFRAAVEEVGSHAKDRERPDAQSVFPSERVRTSSLVGRRRSPERRGYGG